MSEQHDVAIFVYEQPDGMATAFRARCSCRWASAVLLDRREAHAAGFAHEAAAEHCGGVASKGEGER